MTLADRGRAFNLSRAQAPLRRRVRTAGGGSFRGSISGIMPSLATPAAKLAIVVALDAVRDPSPGRRQIMGSISPPAAAAIIVARPPLPFLLVCFAPPFLLHATLRAGRAEA
jgi:hypothetical protein